MRKVPKLRFKEFSDEWEEKRLGDLILLQRGSSPRPISKYLTNSSDGVNWIKIGDTNKENKYITSTSEKITKEGAKKSREVKKGEIILSNSMSYGRPFILKIDGYIHDGWFVIRKYEEHFNKEFLCQLLGSDFIQNQYKKLAAGGVVENISSELVNSVIIKVVSLKEQQKIANFLSSVDKKISLTEEKLKLFKKYKKGVMQKIFSQKLRFKDSEGNDYPEWEEKKLEEIIKMGKAGGTPKTSKKEFYENGNIKFLSISDMTSQGKYIYSTEKYITEEGLKNSSAWKVPINSLIYSMYASVGFVSINKIELTTSQAMFSIIPQDNVSLEYLYYFLSNLKNAINKFIEKGTQGNLSAESIKNFNIKLPILEEQQKISDFLLK